MPICVSRWDVRNRCGCITDQRPYMGHGVGKLAMSLSAIADSLVPLVSVAKARGSQRRGEQGEESGGKSPHADVSVGVCPGV